MPSDWVGIGADCQLPRSVSTLLEDELMSSPQEISCLDPSCSQQGAGVSVASGTVNAGDLEHFLLEAQRGSEQGRLFLLNPKRP